jgi:hypothetical protein
MCKATGFVPKRIPWKPRIRDSQSYIRCQAGARARILMQEQGGRHSDSARPPMFCWGNLCRGEPCEMVVVGSSISSTRSTPQGSRTSIRLAFAARFDDDVVDDDDDCDLHGHHGVVVFPSVG